MTLDFRQRLLATSLLVGVSVLATPAYAQTTPPPAPPEGGPTDTTQPSGPVEAQPTPQVNAQGAPTAPPAQGEIIVTGSRIPQPNLTSAAPVTVVSNQDVKLSGATRVEDVLNQLPSVQPSQGSGVSNGATGAATVDLRDLGSKRTLVLINGRRLMPGDPNTASQAADLNVIPSALIKRVEVLTGGASSVYGADAVAGVVNFIMDTEFTGIRLDGTYSFYNHNNNCPNVSTTSANGGTVCSISQLRINQGLNGYSFPRGMTTDGGAFDGTVSLGAKFDDGRGHAMAYFGYRNVKPVLQARRDYSSCGLSGNTTVTCGGSLTSVPGHAFIFTTSGGASTTAALGPGTLTLGQGPRFNFNPYNYYQRPDERYIGGAFANYEVADEIKPYLEFMFMDDHTLAQIAPSGDFGNTFMVNCDNPLLSQQQHDLLCTNPNLIAGFAGGIPVANGASFAPDLLPAGFGPLTFFDARGNQFTQAYFNVLRRNVEGGPRINDLTHTNFRGVLGSRGDLSNVWSYDTYFQYGRTNYSQVYRNEFSTARLNRALNVAAVDANGVVVQPTGFDPVTGLPIFPTGTQIICRSVLDNTDPNCVPLDLFSGNGLTPAMINYLNVFGVIEGRTNEQVANLNFTGALGEMGIQTPWSDEGIGINVGAEYRKESLTLNPDQEFQTGDLTGQGAPTLPVSGNFRVLEIFGETEIPIIKHSFIEELSLNLGYRKSWYQTHPGPELRDLNGNPLPSNSFNTDTYKISAEFAPVKDIRFRGAYNRAVRAPNIQELFAPTFVGLDASTDPCTAGQPDVGTLGCTVQGVGAAGTPENPAQQYNGLLGGNPTLEPEKATTKTLGFVAQPRFIPRLALTIDWYDIKIDNAIQPFGADAILTNCTNLTNQTGTAAPSCALIHRAPGGSLWLSPNGFVEDLPHNVGGVETKGFDGSAAYSMGLGGLGNLSASVIGTLLRSYEVDDGLNPRYECAGFYGAVCGNPLPKWRHKARTTLQMRNGIGISLQWRYVGKVRSERLSSDDVLTGPVPTQLSHVKAQNYFDLAGTFDIGDHYALRLGVNNILDNTPPLFTANRGACSVVFCNGNTYVGTYDALGRYIYAGATLNF